MSKPNEFTSEQQSYLQGFALGADVARVVQGLPILSGSATKPGTTIKIGSTPQAAGSTAIHRAAQDRFLAEGRTLTAEDQAKRSKDPFAMWDEIHGNAREGRFPKGTDVFLYKYSGLFYVAPAQNSFMCRLRIPGGVLSSWQFRGVADLAKRYGAGHVDVTTRANLQIREIGPESAPDVLTGLVDLGIMNRGAGADNIRNITASPLSGIDPRELIETLPLAKSLHHHILNNSELYGLPRKFNVAFEGGGRISSLDDTNDIGFRAVTISAANAGADVSAGVYFQLTLGGITGHKDFARPTGVLLRPEECVSVASAIIRVFIRSGDRTDRRKARLKYVLDAWGVDRFLDEVEKEHGQPLRRVSLDRYDPQPGDNRWAHVGFHPQKQPGLCYVGVILPVGRLTVEQAYGLVRIADRFGSGTIRLTVWQNLLISEIAETDIDSVKDAIERLGLDWDASSVRSGLVACTGSAGCKFAAADTKANAMALATYLDERVALDAPINIHLTGCHHSCAQHYIGDIGLEATKVEVDEEMVEGYHICVGGGWGAEQGIGRRLLDSVPYREIPPLIEQLLLHYLESRESPEESFAVFTRRHSLDELRDYMNCPARDCVPN
jgi:ferredoxin-nitrite reductase